MSKQCVLEITDRGDQNVIFETPVILDTLLRSFLKLPAPIIAYYNENPVALNRDLVADSYTEKYGTSSIYVEVQDSDKPVYSNIHPFYGRHPLTCTEWVKLMDENIELLCREFMPVEDGEYTETSLEGNVTIYKQYLCRKHPEIGLVFRHSSCETSTSARLYLEKDNVVYYFPSKVFNRTSGRYNRFTSAYYPESIKMMLTSISTLDIEDLNTTAYLLYEGVSMTKPLSVEELQTILMGCSMYAPESLKSLYEEILDPTDDHMMDLLWRCTNLKKSLGEVLKTFSTGTPKNPEVREFLGSLLYHPLVADRLYKG